MQQSSLVSQSLAYLLILFSFPNDTCIEKTFLKFVFRLSLLFWTTYKGGGWKVNIIAADDLTSTATLMEELWTREQGLRWEKNLIWSSSVCVSWSAY